MSFNRVILLGNVGRDPEVRHFDGGASVANFTVATSERFKDRTGTLQERTEWHNLVCRNPLSDVVEKYVRKGTQVFIEGKIRTRSYEQGGQKKYVTEIHVDTLQLVGKKADNPASQDGGYRPQQQQYNAPRQYAEPRAAEPARQNDIPDFQDFSAGADDLPF